MNIVADNFKHMLSVIKDTYCCESSEDYASDLAKKECLQACIYECSDINNLPPTMLQQYNDHCESINTYNIKSSEELEQGVEQYHQMLFWLLENPTYFPIIIAQKLSEKLTTLIRESNDRWTPHPTPTLQEWCGNRTRIYYSLLEQIDRRLSFTDAFKLLENQ